MNSGKLYIQPQNEPHGEGEGWEDCRNIDATTWTISDDDQIYEAFNTREEAKDYLKRNQS